MSVRNVLYDHRRVGGRAATNCMTKFATAENFQTFSCGGFPGGLFDGADEAAQPEVVWVHRPGGIDRLTDAFLPYALRDIRPTIAAIVRIHWGATLVDRPHRLQNRVPILSYGPQLSMDGGQFAQAREILYAIIGQANRDEGTSWYDHVVTHGDWLYNPNAARLFNIGNDDPGTTFFVYVLTELQRYQQARRILVDRHRDIGHLLNEYNNIAAGGTDRDEALRRAVSSHQPDAVPPPFRSETEQLMHASSAADAGKSELDANKAMIGEKLAQWLQDIHGGAIAAGITEEEWTAAQSRAMADLKSLMCKWD